MLPRIPKTTTIKQFSYKGDLSKSDKVKGQLQGKIILINCYTSQQVPSSILRLSNVYLVQVTSRYKKMQCIDCLQNVYDYLTMKEIISFYVLTEYQSHKTIACAIYLNKAVHWDRELAESRHAEQLKTLSTYWVLLNCNTILH